MKTKIIKISPDRSKAGLYDMPADGDEILTLPCGRIFLLADRWCGDDVEGWCYRRHVAEIDEAIATALVAGRDPGLLDLRWVRLSRAPIWLRRAYATAKTQYNNPDES